MSGCYANAKQFEKAVEVIVDQLKKNPLPVAKHPAFPNYHDQPAQGVPAGQSTRDNKK